MTNSKPTVESGPSNITPNLDTAAVKRAALEKKFRVAILFIMPLIMVGMMITGYLGAMHAPKPQDMPIATVGVSASLETQLNDNPALKVTAYPSAEEARDAVFDREVTAAVIVDGSNADFVYASGAGSQLRSALQSTLVPELVTAGLAVEADDVAPLPSEDPAGIAAMMMMTSLLLASYLPFSFIVNNSPELLRLKRAIPLLGGWAALIAALEVIIAGPVIGVLDSSHYLGVFGIGWLSVMAVGSVQLFLTHAIGSGGTIVGLLLLMVLGVPSSNMSYPIWSMPDLHQWCYHFLPTPAIGEALRSYLYFNGKGTGPHLWLLAGGLVIGLALTWLYDAWKRNRNPHPRPIVLNMPSLHGGARPKTKFMRYAALFIFPFLMVSTMLTAMLGAMGSPSPEDAPVAIVSSSAEAAQQTADGLDAKMADMFEFTTMTNEAEAREMVGDRELIGAVVLPSQDNPQPTLIQNSAANFSAATIVHQVFSQVFEAQGMQLAIDDIHPLPESDSSGVVTMYIAMGWLMAGFMIIVVASTAAPHVRRMRHMLPLLAAYAPYMSLVVWLIAGPITHSVSGHGLALWLAGTPFIFCISMFGMLIERYLGMLAVFPIVLTLMFLGVPSSNGAISVYLAPYFFRNLHDFLPMGAAVDVIKSIIYFGGDDYSGLKTIAIWGIVCLLLVIITDHFKSVRTTTEYVTVPGDSIVGPARISKTNAARLP